MSEKLNTALILVECLQDLELHAEDLKIFSDLLKKQGVNKIEVINFSKNSEANHFNLDRSKIEVVSSSKLDGTWFLKCPEKILIFQKISFFCSNISQFSLVDETLLGISPKSGNRERPFFDENENLIQSIDESKNKEWNNHFSYCGVFACNKKALENFLTQSKKPYEMNEYNLSLLSNPKALALSGTFYPDLGVKSEKTNAVNWKNYLSNSIRPCLFLDRDGIINEDTGYPHKIEDIKILKEIVPIIKMAKKNHWWVIVLTNQAGIARGKFQLDDFKKVTTFLDKSLEELEAKPDAWFYSPYHPKGDVEPYNMHSLDRKPFPGMLLKAMQNFPIDIEKSFMVGDRDTDALHVKQLTSLLIQGRYEIKNSKIKKFPSHKDLETYFESVFMN